LERQHEGKSAFERFDIPGPLRLQAPASMTTTNDKRTPTMEDIGRRAGVSAATVSRVVNKNVPVDPATERRVREAIQELGYRPNLLARSFRRSVTQTIGLLVPDNSNPFFAEIARVIEDAGFSDGYSVILCNSDLSRTKQSAYVDVLLAKRVDGIIMISTGLIPGEDAGRDIERIQQAGVPCVIIDRDLAGAPVDQLLVDNHEGGYLAGKYLIENGHRRLACVVGPSDLTPSAGRIAGFRRALDEAGINLPANALVRGNGRHDGGSRAVAELLERGVAFSAVFAFNDEMAIGVIGALQRAGRKVPGDISVIGFDNIPYTAAVFPAVTTIAQPIAEMGSTGLRMLLDRIRQPHVPPRRLVLSTRLLERESVAPLVTAGT
jgi:LacI family transcriptional regulator